MSQSPLTPEEFKQAYFANRMQDPSSLVVRKHSRVETPEAKRNFGDPVVCMQDMTFCWNSLKLSLPLVLYVIRRGPTLMSALEMRGFRRGSPRLGNIDFWDAIYFLIGLTVFILATSDRFGWFAFDFKSLIPF